MRGAWEAWTRGDALPGRTMADLKIAGFRELLDAHPDAGSVDGLVEAWMAWEKGKVEPRETLAALDEAGVGEMLARLAAV